MRNKLLLVLTLAALAGCGNGDGLGNFEHKTMTVSARYAETGDPQVVGVTVYLWGPDNSCPVAKSDLQGTVNGAPLTVEELGANDDDGFDLGWTSPCLATRLRGPFSGSGPLDVRVWDSTGGVSATFAASFEERTLELVEPKDGQLYIGDRVVLRYAPGSDELRNGGSGLNIWSSFGSAPFDRDGELLSFVVPEATVAFIPGNDTLRLYADVRAKNTSCSGADACVLEPGISAVGNVPVTLVQQARKQ